MTETPTFKVVLLGDLGVGKTCIRSQFVHHIFTNAYKATIGGDYLTTSVLVNDPIPTNDRSITTPSMPAIDSNHTPSNTLPSDQSTNHVQDQPEVVSSNSQSPPQTKVNLQIWDTAGQERFNSISQAFYRGTDIVILVYDITNYESVLSLRNWFKRFMDHCHVSRPGVIIVGNKTDKVNERCVDLEEIREIITNNTDMSVEAYVENWDTDVIEICSKQLSSVTKLFDRVAQLGLEILYNSNDDDDDDNHLKRIIGFDSIDLNGVISRRPTSKCFC